MFKQFRLAAAVLVASVTAAQAITIEAGKSYLGDYSFSGIQPTPNPCCPIISIDTPIRAQQYNIFFGANRLDQGETITLDFTGRVAPPPPPTPDASTSSFTSTNPLGTTSLGLGISSLFDNLSSGVIRISASGGSFDLDKLIVFASVNATVQTTNGPVATTLPIEAMVTNFRLLSPPPPPPPPPNVVPLPASGLMLISVLAGLFGWRHRQYRSM
ncbi:hypothetical protein [uncultured Roseovarius sp.]|uniref:hypothetical protein n=1 Tax=uncultured Roseovarius sp. TaxID=293344 RepID=UPI0026296B51|nr:hypothetical protein [uncultured Roseovarius sp.]